MSYDPIEDVLDESLDINSETIDALKQFDAKEKFERLPGVDTKEEKLRLGKPLSQITTVLIDELKNNQTKLWVLRTFQSALEAVDSEDTEAREHFGLELETIMDIVGIESSDGLLSYYLG